MSGTVLAAESFTYAKKGQALLRGAGIPARIRKIPRLPQEGSCGIGIEVFRDPGVCAALLRGNGVKVLYAVRGGERIDLP